MRRINRMFARAQCRPLPPFASSDFYFRSSEAVKRVLSHGEILAVLEELAPRVCAEPGDEPRFEARNGESCNRLGVCVDPTERNLYMAASDGADLVITHHAWHGEAEEAVKAKNMSIYRLHSAWDMAPDGNMVTLARMLGLHNLVMAEGALTAKADLTLRDLIERGQRVVGAYVLPYCGDLAGGVRIVGIIPGSGFLPIFKPRWEKLAGYGCDTIISGEITHAAARFAQTTGLRLIDFGHNGLVRPGLAHLAYLLKCRLTAYGCPCEFYDDHYAVNYYTAWSLPRQEENHRDEGTGGVVVPFPGV